MVAVPCGVRPVTDRTSHVTSAVAPNRTPAERAAIRLRRVVQTSEDVRPRRVSPSGNTASAAEPSRGQKESGRMTHPTAAATTSTGSAMFNTLLPSQIRRIPPTERAR